MSAAPIDDWDIAFELAAILAELVEANSQAAEHARRLVAGELVSLDPLATIGAELLQLVGEARGTLARFHAWAEQT